MLRIGQGVLFWLSLIVCNLATAGSRVDVLVEGVQDEVLLNNIHAYLQLYQKRDDPKLSDNWIRHLHDSAPDEISTALQPYGYYNVTIDPNLERLESGKWSASYRLDIGEQIKISSIDIQWQGEGAEEPKLVAATKAFPLKVGQPLIHAEYEKARDHLLTQAGLMGYHDIETTVRHVLVNPARNSAVVQLHFNTGNKYYLGGLTLEQDVLDPEFVHRYLVDINEGDPYSQEALLEIQRILVESGYFSLVNVKPRFQLAENNRVPINVKLSPSKRQTYAFGLGYNTDIGVNGSIRWQHRRLNQRGHRADALMRLSTKENLIRGGYWIPIKDPRHYKIGLTAELETNQTDDAEWVSLNLNAGYYLIREKWKYRVYVDFLVEEFTAGSEPTETTALLSAGGGLEKHALEAGEYPRRGWTVALDGRVSPGVVSSTAFTRIYSKGMFLLPVAERGRLILRGELGGAVVDKFEKYPASLRFFAGGDQSIRGYDYESVGPEDEKGRVVGGRNIITSTIEYNHLLGEKWGAAIFVDAGNAFNDELDKLLIGAGVGARYLSPVGMVRLDFAWAMNETDEDPILSDYLIHFGFEVNL